MENVSCITSNTCCNALIKLKCWLILAKYGASKLEIVKQHTQDAALEEYEVRLYLKNRFSVVSDKFTNFMHQVFNKMLNSISNYIHSTDSSILLEKGNDSLWLLHNAINNDITYGSSFFTSGSHLNCSAVFNDVRNEILSIIQYWPDAITLSYSNFISSSLSEILVHKVREIIINYENMTQSADIHWLCEMLMKSDQSRITDSNEFWFVNTTLVWNSLDDTLPLNEFYFDTESELVQKLTDWLFIKCTNDLKCSMDRLTNSINEKLGTRIFDKVQLTTLLGLSASELELYLMETEDQFHNGFNLAEGPHYFVSELIELQTYRQENGSDENSIHTESTIKNGFDVLASVLQDYGDGELNNKITCIKELFGEFFDEQKLMSNSNEIRDSYKTIYVENNDEQPVKTEIEDLTHKLIVPKLQVIGRNPAEQGKPPCMHHKKRGRPRKVDEHNHSSTKNGQHKYSQENVLDCSNWINDNFFEVVGNKPAIDRARLYELYTNYCLLKLCTPVDRALFGKIIRKVFPKLRSRRLIQNQVLKYHYVGLTPRFVELEQALLQSDSSVNLQEIVLSYDRSAD